VQASGTKQSGSSEQIRRLTDLIQRRHLINQQIISPFLTGGTPDAQFELTLTLNDLTKEIDELSSNLESNEPDFSNIYMPRPMKVADVQSLLGPNEALIQYAVFKGSAFAWLVTSTRMDFKRLEIGSPQEIDDLVDALRCGLDRNAWNHNAEKCKKALGTADVPAPAKTLPFDLIKAKRLYDIVLMPFRDSVGGKQLIIVPSGSLGKLPFATLVTDLPDTREIGFRSASWLGLTSAISVLSSASMLKILRTTVKQSEAKRSYVGFGNPLLIGGPADNLRAREASDRQACDAVADPGRLGDSRKGADLPPIADLFAGRLGAPDKLRSLRPLPESAQELCEVSGDLGGVPDDVHLGSSATETAVKQLSSVGALRDYRIVHFSTHGLLATETASYSKDLAEPALVMTPPANATEIDDGLLPATEIALLDLNSDWVVLSACNTAAGDSESADPYAGLARAFFYAGTRSILASHWSVDAEASRLLISHTFAEEGAKSARLSRAERLRLAIKYMIKDYPDPIAANPEYWAPFVIVGEGAD
jgi:CHAT domain-containing protein